MNAWKRIGCLITMILVLISCTAGVADQHILHEPTKEQLTETQAVHAAALFFEELTGVPAKDIEKFYVSGEEKSFGPGWQWQADTEDDCWAISFRTHGLPIEFMYVTLHGTTGEALYWEYIDSMTQTTYLHMQPEEGLIQYEEAYGIAVEDMAAKLAMEKETILKNAWVQSTYGMPYTNFEIAGRDEDALNTPVWDIIIFYPAEAPLRVYQAVINAQDGAISNSYAEEYKP